ncbi:MAG: prepilin-type N-terminal cleavage/methylation domain-containing protein [Nitrospirae bacterium]|nr:prepilin-type N-terminal cleavage/methylation domain-containing protein [Nitrospirota bacterium]MCL5062086.1 prepilin-type N-terminal cleavage/methylation domain-containing protein [Nitrospirota bacterium]MDA8338975.1 prepilin-type N-terminal cleavage/methylation domain-containing protein [Nitrospiraceae bacterium]
MFKAISKMKVRDERGFTLVELLIVIAIIAILAAIAIPQFAQYRQRAVESSMTSDIKAAATAVEAVYVDAQTYNALAVAIAGQEATWSVGANSAKSRISTNNVPSVNAAAANTYSLCVNNPNARATRLFVATNQTGGLGWEASCAAAVAAIPK